MFAWFYINFLNGFPWRGVVLTDTEHPCPNWYFSVNINLVAYSRVSLDSSRWAHTTEGLPTWGSILPVHYCAAVRTSGSPPAHVRGLTSPFHLLQSVSRSIFFSLPATAGLRDQEPALPWQLVLSPSLNRSFLDRCIPSTLKASQMCTQKPPTLRWFWSNKTERTFFNRRLQ